MNLQNNDGASAYRNRNPILKKIHRSRAVLAQLYIAAMLGLAPLTFAAQGQLTTAPELLSADEAFQVSARMISPKTIELHYTIADGYYMYRGRFKFAAENESAVLDKAIMPAGKVKHDATFGRVETYRRSVSVRLPVSSINSVGKSLLAETDLIRIKVTSQGCADVGVCYPPLHHQFILNTHSRDQVSPVAGLTSTANTNPNQLAPSGANAMKPAASISDLIRKSP